VISELEKAGARIFHQALKEELAAQLAESEDQAGDQPQTKE